MKKFTFKNVLEGFRSSSNAGGGPGSGGPGGIGGSGADRAFQINEVVENLRPENFSVTKVRPCVFVYFCVYFAVSV